MPKIPEFNPIDFLVAHKFPRPASSLGQNVGGSVGWVSSSDWSEKQHPQYNQIKKYRAELAKKTPQEIEEMCETIRREWEEQVERKRFFHQPDADADFEYWAKMAHWTLEEAIALSFGKNPKIVTKERMSRGDSGDYGFWKSPFVEEYRKLWDLAKRAKDWGQLYDTTMPPIYVSWAKKNDINFPQALADQVKLRSGNLFDWKKLYDENSEKHSEYVKTSEAFINDQKEEIKKLRALLALKDEQEKNENKPVHSKERDTFLKMIIALAVEGLGYDPMATKSPIPKEISDYLVKLGIPLDPDTVRAKLKEAADLLPQATEIKMAKPKSV